MKAMLFASWLWCRFSYRAADTLTYDQQEAFLEPRKSPRKRHRKRASPARFA